MTRDQEPITALVACIPSHVPPRVPSKAMDCDECGTAIWVSDNALAGFAESEATEVRYVCFPCSAKLADDEPIVMPSWQRDYLNKLGHSDEDIDRAVRLGNEMRKEA